MAATLPGSFELSAGAGTPAHPAPETDEIVVPLIHGFAIRFLRGVVDEIERRPQRCVKGLKK